MNAFVSSKSVIYYRRDSHSLIMGISDVMIGPKRPQTAQNYTNINYLFVSTKVLFSSKMFVIN